MKKTKRDEPTIFFVLRYVKPYWKALVLLLICNTFVILLTTLLPILMATILDIALGGKQFTGDAISMDIGISNLDLGNIGNLTFQLLEISEINNHLKMVGMLALIYSAIGILQGFASFGSGLLGRWIQVHTQRNMQFSLLQHLFSLSMDFFDREKLGALLSRLENDTSAASFGIHIIFTQLLITPVLIAFYGTLLIRTNPFLAVAATLVAIIHIGITRGITGPIRRNLKDQFSAIAELSASFQETLLNIRIVKSFAAEKFELKRLKEEIRKVINANIKFSVYKHIEEPARNTVLIISETMIVILAAREFLIGNLEASTFIMFLYVGRAIMSPLGRLATAFTQIQAMSAAASSVYELCNEVPTVCDGELIIKEFSDELKIQNMSFSYNKGKDVLKEIFLTIEKGEIVALVGPSGAGKSTLTDLILRFYDRSDGEIFIDGNDIRNLKIENYRRLFGVVSQESFLFNASVQDNLLYGRKGYDKHDIEMAANLANANEFINSLPEKYDTLIGDRGVRLSGGQRQRLSIARAILGNPEILIFDEATSSLDSESERQMQDAMERVLEDKTAIVIAHRLSTVLKANKIVVINEGRIEMIGIHEDLLRDSPTYSRLYHLQFDH